MPWAEGTVDASDIEIHYVRTGDSGKPTAVLIHGFTDNGRCWTRLARALESTFDVVMVDSRNHGESGAAVGSCTEMAADIAAVINRLELGPTAVIGHSLGAATAAELAAVRPDLVTRLILEDPPWQARQADAVPHEVRRRGLQAFVDSFAGLSYDEILAMGRTQHPGWHERDLPDWATAKQQVRSEAIESITPLAWAGTVRLLRCPTLLIRGDSALGGVVGERVAAEVTALNPLISGVQIEGTGHNIRREGFEDYLEHVQAFLADR